MSNDPPLLSLRNVGRRMGSNFAVEIRRLVLERGAIVALLGPSGCGKSTALDLVSAMLRPLEPQQFQFHPEGRDSYDIAALWGNNNRRALTRLRGCHMGYVLQTGGLLPFLTVEENIRVSVRVSGSTASPEHVSALVKQLGLSRLVRRLPSQLSIGQRQRVAIARALAHRPSLILADEPTASLDPGHKEAAFQSLLDAVRLTGASAIIATHDRDLVARSGIGAMVFESMIEGDMEYSFIDYSGGMGDSCQH
jgi:putative ABC transport system ATP-binding protein